MNIIDSHMFQENKTRQAAANKLQDAYRIKRASSELEGARLTKTYLMLDRALSEALSEAQSQKDTCKNYQEVNNDDLTHISTDDSEFSDSSCCSSSQCGFQDDVHEMCEILRSPVRWFCDCICPSKNKDTANNID